jgi:hypothetical protein
MPEREAFSTGLAADLPHGQGAPGRG